MKKADKRKMQKGLEQKAELLAAQPYSVKITPDETTDGEPIFVASTPELPGCKSHGSTIEEALSNLADAQKEYIIGLLQDGDPVPFPMGRNADSTSYRGYFGKVTIELNNEKAGEPKHQQRDVAFPAPEKHVELPEAEFPESGMILSRSA